MVGRARRVTDIRTILGIGIREGIGNRIGGGMRNP
tara:strand:- start:301 stop:405 length:105 start_codon:yes stop_codon:yes gene_type:complete